MTAFVVSAFLMGLFGGVHCVTMCGGVVGVLCSAAPRCPSGEIRRGQARYWVAYNLGRVLSYALLGLLFGTLGSLSTGLFPLDSIRFALRAFAGLSMLAIGLHLAGFPSPIKTLESVGAPLWRPVSRFAKRFVPLRKPSQALVLGALWGLMPCGLLYAAFALAASSESPMVGMAAMVAFGVATLPIMFTMGAIAQSVTRWLARGWVRRTAGVIVLAFGFWSSLGAAAQAGITTPFGIGAAAHCGTR
jgi:sulfite exporter TauE/SafE